MTDQDPARKFCDQEHVCTGPGAWQASAAIMIHIFRQPLDAELSSDTFLRNSGHFIIEYRYSFFHRKLQVTSTTTTWKYTYISSRYMIYVTSDENPGAKTDYRVQRLLLCIWICRAFPQVFITWRVWSRRLDKSSYRPLIPPGHWLCTASHRLSGMGSYGARPGEGGWRRGVRLDWNPAVWTGALAVFSPGSS